MLSMNQEAVGCSSGCESGWTMYLEHSVRAPAPPPCEIQDGECEEEDLSMVSDASSGPPHLQSEDVPTQNSRGGEENDPAAAANGSCLYASSKRRRVQNSEHNPSSSDDTASSHLVSKDIVSPGDGQSMEHFLDFSQGFSTTSFKKQPAYQEGFRVMKSPTPGDPISAEGKKMALSNRLHSAFSHTETRK